MLCNLKFMHLKKSWKSYMKSLTFIASYVELVYSSSYAGMNNATITEIKWISSVNGFCFSFCSGGKVISNVDTSKTYHC